MTTPFTAFTDWLDSHPYSQSENLSPVITVTKDFDVAAAAVENGTAVLANDVFELIDVPANTFVHGVRVDVLTAEGAASTIDVGDGATADGYHDGLDANDATVNVYSWDEDGTKTEAFGHGKFYSAADTIDLKVMTGSWLAFKVRLTATMIRLG
jgi:hypothetical protein